MSRHLKIYVASSWRNTHQPFVVEGLRKEGFEVYDFKHPYPDEPERAGFGWSEVDPNWRTNWRGPREWVPALQHPAARAGFNRDMDALDDADLVVLVTPCGKSAHLELGYAAGALKPTCMLVLDPMEAELMYSMADCIVSNLDETIQFCHAVAEVLGKYGFVPAKGAAMHEQAAKWFAALQTAKRAVVIEEVK